MQSLHAALTQLDVAISRLEAALDTQAARWQAERDELVRALDAARGAEGKARSQVADVATRLDSAIGRLQSVLED